MDDALNESMLNPKIQEIEVKDYSDETRTNEVIEEEKPSTELVDSNEGNVEGIIIESLEDELITDNVENDETGDKVIQTVRRSNRNRNQRFNIHPDEIGECDDEKDDDYK